MAIWWTNHIHPWVVAEQVLSVVGILQDEADPMVSVMKASGLSAHCHHWLGWMCSLPYASASGEIGIFTKSCSANAIYNIAVSAQDMPGCAIDWVAVATGGEGSPGVLCRRGRP